MQSIQDETVTTLGDRESSLKVLLIAKIIKRQCKTVHCWNGTETVQCWNGTDRGKGNWSYCHFFFHLDPIINGDCTYSCVTAVCFSEMQSFCTRY